MKTSFLSFFLCVFTSTVFAQSSLKLALQAGVTASKPAAMGGDFDDIRTEQHVVTGFHAGLLADIRLANTLLFRSGLQLERRGFAFELNQSEIHYEARYQPYYLQIPAVIALTNGHLYAGLGPYVAYGLGGSYHSEWSATPGRVILLPVPQDRNLKWGKNAAKDDFQRLDAGLQFEAGLTVWRFRLSGAYEMGLINIQPHPDASGVVKKSRTFSLALGFLFGHF